MLFVKIFGVLFLCSLAATDMITFKPFVKSRYSLRERRAKNTTAAPLIKSTDTASDSSSSGVINGSVSTLAPTQFLETTEKDLQDSDGKSTEVTEAHTSISTTQDSTSTSTTTTTATTTSISTSELTSTTTSSPKSLTTTTAPQLGAVDKISSTSSSRPTFDIENIKGVTEKALVLDTTSPNKIETTTLTEWLYDYYAADDENPKRETSA